MISVCLKELKKLRYDLMVDFSNAPEYGFTGKFLLKIPVRVGFDYKQRGRFLTDKIHIEGFSKKHIVEHYLDLLRKLEIPTPDEKLNFPVADKTIRWAKKFLDESGIKDSDLLIGISPGGGASWGRDANLKHWSQGNFSELAKLLIGEHRAKILLFGSYGEIELCKQVKDSINKKDVIDTSGRLDLKEFAALIKSCKVFICNDGGPLHIAKSQDASTVSIFGPVDSDVYGPYPRNNRDRIVEATLSCRPCYRNFKMSDCRRRDCFTNINPKEVFEEVSKLLG